MGIIVQLKNVRIAFIDDLFEPSQYEGKGDFRHTATFIVQTFAYTGFQASAVRSSSRAVLSASLPSAA